MENKEYNVVFEIHGHASDVDHIGRAVFADKTVSRDENDDIVFILKNGAISFDVKACTPEEAYSKAVILLLGTDKGTLVIDEWSLLYIYVFYEGKRFYPENLDNINSETTSTIEKAYENWVKKHKGNFKIEIASPWNEKYHYGFNTKTEAFKQACTLACAEAYAQNEDAEPGKTCMVYFDAANNVINLYRTVDNVMHQYKVVPIEPHDLYECEETLIEAYDNNEFNIQSTFLLTTAAMLPFFL